MKDKKDKLSDKEVKEVKKLEEDVPSYNTESIESFELRTGHGFWGNSHTGYITDEQLNDM